MAGGKHNSPTGLRTPPGKLNRRPPATGTAPADYGLVLTSAAPWRPALACIGRQGFSGTESRQTFLSPRQQIMGKPLLMRFARVLRSSLFRRQNFLILAAPATDAPGPTAPLGSILLRVNSRSDEAHCAQAEKAMLDAGEPPALTAPRLVHGDEFFGWLVDSHVVSFGWVSYRERVVGCQRLRDTAGRAFLYNFHTIMAFRGHGLYAALLLAIRHVLSNEGAVEFIIDAEKRNRVSLNGIGAAGFAMVAQAGFGLLFNHWRWPHWRSVVTTTHRDLFSE